MQPVPAAFLVNHLASCYYVYNDLLQSNMIRYQRNRLADIKGVDDLWAYL